MKKFNYKRYIEAIGILENNKNMGSNCKDSYLQKNTIGVTTFYTATSIEKLISRLLSIFHEWNTGDFNFSLNFSTLCRETNNSMHF